VDVELRVVGDLHEADQRTMESHPWERILLPVHVLKFIQQDDKKEEDQQ
jgi:hypothetical protein